MISGQSALTASAGTSGCMGAEPQWALVFRSRAQAGAIHLRTISDVQRQVCSTGDILRWQPALPQVLVMESERSKLAVPGPFPVMDRLLV